MNRFLKVLIISVFVVFLCMGSAWAIPSWNDGVFNASEYSSLFQEDNDNSGPVGPGYGGQAFDVEYLGLSIVDTKLYFGLQAGLPLSWGDRNMAVSTYQQPGDLAINFGNDNTWEYGFRFWENSISVLEAKDGWESVHYSPQHDESGPWRVKGQYPSVVNSADFKYAFGGTSDKYGNNSYFLEGYIDLSTLGYSDYDPTMSVAANFTMYCGNDYGRTSVNPVPEPATMLLFGIGLISIAGFGRKKLIKK